MVNKIFLFLCLIPLLSNYATVDEHAVYKVTRLSHPVEINGIWNKAPWENVPALTIDNHMGDTPEHKPKVQAKVAYDEQAIYVIFRVKDQYVRCVTEQYQGSVYKDSCVEFFFTPASDVSKGYFNLEMNCIGTALFHVHNARRENVTKIPASDFAQVEVAHSIPSVVNPEIKTPLTWTVEYRIPFSIIDKYFDMTYPAAGVQWKANFYKIADDTSHPHWLTWSVVDLPKPDFHRPEFFGTLEF